MHGKGDASRSALRVALLAREAICEKRREIDVIAFSWSGASTPSVPGRRLRVIAHTARNHTLICAATADKHANSGVFTRHCAPASPLPSPDAWPYGPRNEVRRTVTVASMTTSVEVVMRGLTTFARYLVRSALVVCVVSLAAPCAAQDVDPPTPPDLTGDGRGSLFAPSAWMVLNAPVQKQIGLKFYRFLHRRIEHTSRTS